MLADITGMCHTHFSSDLAAFDGPNRGLTATATSGGQHAGHHVTDMTQLSAIEKVSISANDFDSGSAF
jgi:hypothetical protein